MSVFLRPVQEAIYAALSTDVMLQNMVSAVYDTVTDDAQYPFVCIEGVRAQDWLFSGSLGAQLDVTLEVYSRYRGKSEAYDILQCLHDILHDADVIAVGLHIVQCRVVDTRVDTLNDERSQRARMRVELYVHEDSI